MTALSAAFDKFLNTASCTCEAGEVCLLSFGSFSFYERTFHPSTCLGFSVSMIVIYLCESSLRKDLLNMMDQNDA